MQNNNELLSFTQRLKNSSVDPRSILYDISPGEIIRLIDEGLAYTSDPCTLSEKGKSEKFYVGRSIAHQGDIFKYISVVLAGIVVRYNSVMENNEERWAGFDGELIKKTYLHDYTKMFQMFGVGECVGGYEFLLSKKVWATSAFQLKDTILLNIDMDAFKKHDTKASGITLDKIRANMSSYAVKQWFQVQRELQEYHYRNFRNADEAEKYADSIYLVCNALEKLTKVDTSGSMTLSMTVKEIAYYSTLRYGAARHAFDDLVKQGIIVPMFDGVFDPNAVFEGEDATIEDKANVDFENEASEAKKKRRVGRGNAQYNIHTFLLREKIIGHSFFPSP